MALRKKLIIAAIVAAAVFLAGFVPQYLESRRLRDQAEASAQLFQALERRLEMAELRDTLALAYLETNRKNYGMARQYSTQFFTRAREIANQTADPGLKSALEQALQQRDDITAGLTAGDGAVRDSVESLYQRIHEATQQVQ
jgi:uncharacterized membrane protein YdfJ with MMPL/SSD domain